MRFRRRYKKLRDEFSRFHPLVNLIFYLAVLGITMFQMQAGLIVISLIFSSVYHFYLKKFDGLKYMAMVLFVFVMSAIINPLFSHKGATLLFYLFTGNPVTFESIVYGVATAAIIGAMLLWFSTFNEVITQDKLLAGIGKVMPHIATLLSMVFRFVPKFTRQGGAVLNANKALGAKTEGFKDKLKTQAEVFSITTTWALENSVDTVDSMRARGYGTGKRSSYSNYKFEVRDFVTILWILILFLIVCVEIVTGRAVTYYYPIIRIKGTMLVYITYTLLCMTPIIINLMEAVRWHKLKSKI